MTATFPCPRRRARGIALLFFAAALPALSEHAVVVDTEVACMHLFMILADSTNGPTLVARASLFKDMGFRTDQVKLLIIVANNFTAEVAPLRKQALNVHRGLRAQTMTQTDGVAALKQLDKSRAVELKRTMRQLEGAFGPRAWMQLERFLNGKMKSAIGTDCGTAPNAKACGCNHTRSEMLQSDDETVYSTATLIASYACQVEVSAKITSPSRSLVSHSSGMLDGSSATIGLPIGSLDGTYVGTGSYSFDGTDAGLDQGTYRPLTQSITIKPFIRLVTTSWSNDSIQAQSGTNTFLTRILASQSCTGSMILAVGLTSPSYTAIAWQKNAQNTITHDAPIAGGKTFALTDVVATASDNRVNSGIITATSYFSSYPSGCVPTASGQSATAVMHLTP